MSVRHFLKQRLPCRRHFPFAMFPLILLAHLSLLAGTKDGDVYLKEGERAESLGHFGSARQLYEYALAVDPNNAAYLARLEAIEAHAPKLQRHSSPPTIMLAPQNETIHSLDVNGRQAHSIYQEIGKLTGIKVTLDPSGIDSPESAPKDIIWGRLSDVSVEDALNFVAKTTNTSWNAVSSSTIYVSRFAVPQSIGPSAPFPESPAFDISGMSPDDGLRAAIRAGRLAEVVRLVLKGADVNAHGMTPLMIAISGRDSEIVRILLERGANAKEQNGPDGRGLLHDVCAVGQADFITLLVDFGADPTQRDHLGQTPLNVALEYKNEKAVAVLFKLPGHHEEILSSALGAMEDASVRGYSEIVRILLDNGLDVNKPTSKGSTYLGDAALKGEPTMVNFLLDHGAKLAERNQFGDTALHDAALGGNVDVITALLNRGADINEKGGVTEATPLMMAVEMEHFDAVRVLAGRGADLLLKDKTGRDALDVAKQSGNTKIVQLLSELMTKTPPQ